MKPHEETWEAVTSKDGPLGIVRFPEGWNVDLTGGGRNLACEERALLIAAAPELARLLLPAATTTGTYLAIPRENALAVLRKAGVIADKEQGR